MRFVEITVAVNSTVFRAFLIAIPRKFEKRLKQSTGQMRFSIENISHIMWQSDLFYYPKTKRWCIYKKKKTYSSLRSDFKKKLKLCGGERAKKKKKKTGKTNRNVIIENPLETKYDDVSRVGVQRPQK